MSELITSLGIEWKILLAQIVNFAILFFVLKRFAIGPIMAILERREKKLSEQHNAGEVIEKKLADIEHQKKEILDAARIQSTSIIKDAELAATSLVAEARKVGEAEAASIIQTGKKVIQDERTLAESSLKSEIGTLVADAVEKAVGKAIDKRGHSALVEEAKEIIMSQN